MWGLYFLCDLYSPQWNLSREITMDTSKRTKELHLTIPRTDQVVTYGLSSGNRGARWTQSPGRYQIF